MRLISLKLDNFRQHAETEITFPPGLTGILGTNESGKSTLIEAVIWILFGAKATRGTVKGIRWNGAVGRQIARGELCFEVGGKVYRATRTENDARLYEGEGTSPIAQGITGVDNAIPEILGMDLDEFSATYLCQQKDLNKISAMGGVERQQFVLGLMGISKVDSSLQGCRKKKNALASEVQGLEAGLGEREPLEYELTVSGIDVGESNTHSMVALGNAEKAESAHQAARQKLEESTTRQNQHREFEQNRSQANQQCEAADREITRLEEEEKRAAEASVRVAKVDEQLKGLPVLREERDAIREAKARANERARLVKTIDEQTSEISGLKEKADELARSMPDEPPAVTGLSETQQELAVLQDDRKNRLIEAEKSRAAALSKGGEAEEQLKAISALGPDGKCPTCTNVLGATFNFVLDSLTEITSRSDHDVSELKLQIDALQTPTDEEMELQSQIEGLNEQATAAKEAQDKREQITTRLNELREETARKEQVLSENSNELAAMPEAGYSEERLQEVESRIQALDNLNNQVESDRVLAGRIDSIKEEQVRWEHQRDRSALLIEQATKEIETLGFDPESHTQAFAAAERAREDLTGAKAALARAEEALKAANARHERAQKVLMDWDQRAERFKELQEDLRIHSQTAERLSDFRTAMAASIRPELEELTSGFIHILTDGRHEGVSLTEDFEVILQEGGLDVEVVSGGTEDITSIALRLAISQMIAARAGHPLSLLIFDEPFGSLDEVRRRNVIDLLDRLKGTFEQVLVVTHVDEVKDTVDQVIQVEFDESRNKSRVTAEWAMEVPEIKEEVSEAVTEEVAV